MAKKPAATASEPLAPSPASPPTPEVDLQAPDIFLNRELTWLEFNRRVLHEGMDERGCRT